MDLYDGNGTVISSFINEPFFCQFKSEGTKSFHKDKLNDIIMDEAPQSSELSLCLDYQFTNFI